MDRLELEGKFASRMVKPIRLEEYDIDLHIRKFSATERAGFAERCKVADKSKDDDKMLEIVTKGISCYVIARGLCDEKGNRIYTDEAMETIMEKWPSDALDDIQDKILVFSKLKIPLVDEIKNLPPTPKDSSSSD